MDPGEAMLAMAEAAEATARELEAESDRWADRDRSTAIAYVAAAQGWLMFSLNLRSKVRLP
jgi:hypothetical protein